MTFKITPTSTQNHFLLTSTEYATDAKIAAYIYEHFRQESLESQPLETTRAKTIYWGLPSSVSPFTQKQKAFVSPEGTVYIVESQKRMPDLLYFSGNTKTGRPVRECYPPSEIPLILFKNQVCHTQAKIVHDVQVTKELSPNNPYIQKLFSFMHWETRKNRQKSGFICERQPYDLLTFFMNPNVPQAPRINYLELFIHITKGIKLLTEQNFLHRDLKLQNILFNPETKQITLIDFESCFNTLVEPQIFHATILLAPPEYTFLMSHPNRGTFKKEIIQECVNEKNTVYLLGFIFLQALPLLNIPSTLYEKIETWLSVIDASLAKGNQQQALEEKARNLDPEFIKHLSQKDPSINNFLPIAFESLDHLCDAKEHPFLQLTAEMLLGDPRKRPTLKAVYERITQMEQDPL